MCHLDPDEVDYYRGFRQSTLKLVKLLIRARAKSEPDFLTTEDFRRWGLPDIVDDSRSDKCLLIEAESAHDHIIRMYIGPWGSGGVDPDEPFLDFRSAVIAFTYNEPSEVLALLGNEDRFDWAGAFQWNLLLEIREGLDFLPKEPTVQPDEHSECPVRMGDQKESEVFVLGKPKRLTRTRYNVIEAVVKAFPGTLSKDRLMSNSRQTDAVNMLKIISKLDDDWKSVVRLAETTGGGYG